MCNPNEVSVYQLVDLDSGQVVYVGSSWQPVHRFKQHMQAASNQPMRDYFATHRIGMEILRTVGRAEAHDAEVAAIHAALQRGDCLLNTHTYGWTSSPQLTLFAI